MNIFITLLVIFVLWSLWGYFSSNVEQAKYTVVKKTKDYEIRNYPAHIVAETTVKGDYNESLNEGFRIIAAYIFGANKKNTSIAMTAPVTAKKESSERIAMTSPVTAKKVGKSRTITFGMPSSYTLETLPKPNDSRIKLVKIPAKKFAVLRFSWFRTAKIVSKKEAKLFQSLSKDKIKVKGEATYAGYNAPWTPPWMTRNEVMYEIA